MHGSGYNQGMDRIINLPLMPNPVEFGLTKDNYDGSDGSFYDEAKQRFALALEVWERAIKVIANKG